MGYTFGFVLSYIAGAFYTAWAPQFYARAAQHGDAPQLIEHYCTYLYLLTGLLFVIVTGASYELILTLSTAAYLPARQVIPIVAGAYTLAQIFSFAGPVMVHLKRPQILTLMTLVGAACNFGLNLLLIPQYGFIAAAWNTMAAILVVAVVEGMLSIRMYPYRLETGRLLKVTLAVAITSAVLWWTSALTAGVSHYLILTLKVAVAPVMLALLLLALRFYRRSEVAFARRILRVGAA
jgi:O-antigen/teichoic acid export membrane protein